MKKLFFVLTVVTVLLTNNGLILADNSHISNTSLFISNALPLIDKECQEIMSGLTISPDSKRIVVSITTEELLLPAGVFWIFEEGKKTRIKCLSGFTFVPLPRGNHVLYIIPKKN